MSVKIGRCACGVRTFDGQHRWACLSKAELAQVAAEMRLSPDEVTVSEQAIPALREAHERLGVRRMPIEGAS